MSYSYFRDCPEAVIKINKQVHTHINIKLYTLMYSSPYEELIVKQLLKVCLMRST